MLSETAAGHVEGGPSQYPHPFPLYNDMDLFAVPTTRA